MIKYKFYSSKDVYTYNFTASFIPLWELKSYITTFHLIIADSNLLFFENNVKLEEDTQIYKNSQIIVKRIPAYLTESKQSVKKQKPPTDYLCFRCGKSGHFIQDCPTNNDPTYDFSRITKPTGIPKDFLEEIQTKEGDKGLMVTEEGVCVTAVPRTEDWKEKNEAITVKDFFYCLFCFRIMKFPVKMKCGCLYCFKCRPSECCDGITEYENMVDLFVDINNFILNSKNI